MNAATHPRLLTTSFVAVVLACLYLASATAAEARIDGLKVRQNNIASSTMADKTRSNTASSSLVNYAKPIADVTCMSSAVEVRESALSGAWTDFYGVITMALEDRRAALKDAWAIDNNADRGKAIREAWTAWKADKKEAQTTFRADRKAAWEAFKKTAKEECKVTVPKEEGLEKSSSDSISI